MEVILLEHVDKLGKMGEKVNVKNGYARNYLLPYKKLCAQLKPIWLHMKLKRLNWPPAMPNCWKKQTNWLNL